MTTLKDGKTPDEHSDATKENAAQAANREPRARWIVGIAVALVAALVPIAVAVIDRDDSGSEPEPPATTPTLPSLGPTTNPTTAPASATTTQPTDPTISPSPPVPRPSPAYLTELDYSTAGKDRYVQAGLASIAGKRYKKSFRASQCLSPKIVVMLPPGFSHLSGVVGYDDESSLKTGNYKVQIEETSDADPADPNAEFTRLDVLTIPAGGRRAVPFEEQLSSDTIGIRLSAVKHACSTTIAWGDPKVS